MDLKKFLKSLSPKYQRLFLEYPVQFKPQYSKEHPHPLLYEIINHNRDEYAVMLREAADNREVFINIKKDNEPHQPTEPTYNNGYLPGLDTVGIYTILKHFTPSTYVEIGSGFSTKVAAKAVRDNHLSTRIVSIDPQPRAEIDQLADTVIREPFENINYDFLFEMKENDILFVDNSHRILPNSDATTFLMNVLPYLPTGVIVHLHDIYLPYDYPQFMCDRFYSEQYGLAAFLMANPKRYHPILPNFFISEDETPRSITDPIFDHPNLRGRVERHGGSFWIQIH